MKKILTIAALTAGVVFAGQAEAGQKLSGTQIKALFRGVINGYYKSTPIKAQLTRSGGITAWADGKVDTGSWKIVGDQVCVLFKVWTSNKFKCSHVVREGNWYLAVNNKGKSKIKFRR